jgi:hypothetical protein
MGAFFSGLGTKFSGAFKPKGVTKAFDVSENVGALGRFKAGEGKVSVTLTTKEVKTTTKGGSSIHGNYVAKEYKVRKIERDGVTHYKFKPDKGRSMEFVRVESSKGSNLKKMEVDARGNIHYFKSDDGFVYINAKTLARNENLMRSLKRPEAEEGKAFINEAMGKGTAGSAKVSDDSIISALTAKYDVGGGARINVGHLSGAGRMLTQKSKEELNAFFTSLASKDKGKFDDVVANLSKEERDTISKKLNGMTGKKDFDSASK